MGRPQRVAAFLAVKEDSHVKWHLLFTDKSGKFVTLAILDSVRGFNSLLHKFRIGRERQAKVREDIVRLPDKLKVRGGGGQLYLAHGHEARRLVASTRDLLQRMTGDGISEECYNSGKSMSLSYQDWAVKVYDVYQPPEEMFISDRLGLILRDFLPKTTTAV